MTWHESRVSDSYAVAFFGALLTWDVGNFHQHTHLVEEQISHILLGDLSFLS